MFLTILLSLFSLGQLGRISLFNNQINFYIYEILLAGFFLYLLLKLKLKPLLRSYGKFKWIYWFILSLFLSLILSLHKFSLPQNLIAILYLLRLSFYFLFFLYFQFHYSKKTKSSYSRSILIFSLLTLLFSFSQYFFYPNLRNLYYLGWDPHQYRVFALFFEPSIAAALFGLIIIYFLLANNYLKNNIKKVLVILFSILGLLTYSRGFYISVIAVVAALLIKSKLYKWIFLVIGLFVFLLTLLPRPFGEGVNLRRTATVQARILDYKEAIKIWRVNPILGVGYNHLPQIKELKNKNMTIPDHAASAFHSSFLTVLVTGGIIGLLFFLLALVNLAKISPTSFYYVTFLSVFSLTDNIFLHPYVLFFFLYLMVWEVSLSRRLR